MHHGARPRRGRRGDRGDRGRAFPGPPPPAPRRPPAATLWLQLALCLGPAQLTRGLDELHVCADPGVLEHGFWSPSGAVFFEGSVTRFHCQDGFKLKGSTKRLCVKQLNGTLAWVPSDRPICVQEGCLRPLASSNGYLNVSESQSSFPAGTVIAYRCFPGFKLEGAEHLECLHNLIWSSSPPRCLALEVCPLPPMVSHGDFICHPRPCERYNHGTVVEFYCDPGYSLTSDYKYITCQYGEWFPSYQVYCIKSAEQTWPSTHETLLTTWKIVAFTATSVLLVLLLVILARMFQTKFKAHFPPRGLPRSSSSDPDFVVVDGVPVLLPSYDEAVGGSTSALGPGFLAAMGPGCLMPGDDQSPPAYPGDQEAGMRDSPETCDSASASSELLQSLYPPSPGQVRACHAPQDPTMAPDTREATGTSEAASTSPGIDIADEIPLIEEGP
ncbi:sushi domain-containing protein 4 isoform X3 [Cavia porcellus]|uniref:sushi domain-containing protein 4 isoform X3 n=1 Tax=Cavia porcellus TaxID=10141 RepID=UPI002FE0E44A